MQELIQQYPSPLSVGFYNWEDLSCPKLKFTNFLAVKFDLKNKTNSDVWSDPDITNIIFAGTKTGVILAYKITSKNDELQSIEPLSFIFGHNSPISSIIQCKQTMYDFCVASLSIDGTISIISILDLTIIKNSVNLFSENSQDLSIHQTDNRLALASQTFGTIEIADIYDEKILMRIDGFSSTIYSFTSYGSLNSVACIDGSLNVFSFDSKEIESLYSFKRKENPPCYSIFSPHFVFLLVISPKQWSVHISDSPLFVQELSETEDSFLNGGWANDEIFFLQTKKGHFQLWRFPEFDKKKVTSVVEHLKLNPSSFSVKTKERVLFIKTLPTKKDASFDEEQLKEKIPKPQMVFKCDNVIGPIAVTQEGFVISASSFNPSKTKEKVESEIINSQSDLISSSGSTSRSESNMRKNSDLNSSSDSESAPNLNFNLRTNPKNKSVIYCIDMHNNQLTFDLGDIFTSEVISRCAIGDPATSEARIMKDYSIWVDNKCIGNHQGAKMLFSPCNSSLFFSFSKDGSVKAYSDTCYLTTFYDLSEPISRVQYVYERDWIIVIGKYDSFSVISTRMMCSIALCTGHDSSVIDVSYSNGMLHALCSSAKLYSWNVEGQLVSIKMVKLQKPPSEFGDIAKNPENMPKSESVEPQIALNDINSKKSIPKSKSIQNPALSIQNSSGISVDSSSISSSSSTIFNENSADFSIENFIFQSRRKNSTHKSFYKIKSLYMPNCQTYSIVLDAFKFIKMSKQYSTFNTLASPELFYIVHLWKKHNGSEKINIDYPKKMGNFLNKLNLILAGDNFTVTLPINSKIYDIDKSKEIDENKFISIKDYKYNKKISFFFSPLTTSIHATASSIFAQCISNIQENDLLMMISSLSQTSSTDLIDLSKNIIYPSIPVLASYLLYPSSSIDSIIFNFLSYLINTYDEQRSTNILFTIDHMFGRWEIILPFVLIHCSKFKTLPKIFQQEAWKYVFPLVFQSQEYFTLLKNGFENFSKHINNINEFFQKLITECINNNLNQNQLLCLAIIRPFEFFNSAITQSSKFDTTDLIIALLNKLINPDRTILMSMVCHAINMQKNGYSVKIDEIFSVIMKNNLFFSFSKNYAAFGDINGFIHFISMESGSNVWVTQKVVKNNENNQILYVSFSPSGNLLIFIDSIFDITWISISNNKQIHKEKDKFSILGSSTNNKKFVATEITWKNEQTVVFWKNKEVVYEFRYQKSIFKKLADKFITPK